MFDYLKALMGWTTEKKKCFKCGKEMETPYFENYCRFECLMECSYVL